MTITSLTLVGCDQSSGIKTADSDSEEASLTLREQAINMALEEVPAAKPYVDENGNFLLKETIADGISPANASRLRAEWAEAYAEASRKVLHAG